jgi:hypothetical protein
MSDLVDQLPFDSERTRTERRATSFAEQPELPLNLPPLKRKPWRRWRSWEAVKVMNAAGLEPLEFFRGASRPWKCRCETCGHVFTPCLDNVYHNKTGCPKCAHMARRYCEADAIKTMRAAGFEPLESYPNSYTPWKCHCLKCDSIVWPQFQLVKRGGGCRNCAYTAQLKDSAEAVATMNAAGLFPLEPYLGCGKPWACLCRNCNSIVRPTLGAIQQGGGCRECASNGYKNHKPGTVYLLRSESLRAYKVGITNDPDRRLAKHEKHGWQVCGFLTFDDGSKARDIEQWVLRSWRSAGWAEAVAADLMPQGGWTETVAIVNCGDDLDLNALYAGWLEVAS